MTHSFQQTLRHDDYVIMADPCTTLTWMEAFLTTTDHLDMYTFRYICCSGWGFRATILCRNEIHQFHSKKNVWLLLVNNMACCQAILLQFVCLFVCLAFKCGREEGCSLLVASETKLVTISASARNQIDKHTADICTPINKASLMFWFSEEQLFSL